MRKSLLEYKTKLIVENRVLPDPLGLKDGWLDEKQGMEKWPSLYFEDMAAYLRMKTPKELCTRLLNEYKEGKAYRYFTAGWVREVMYHPITSESTLCFLWCRVCPSFSVREKDYQVWVLMTKDQVGVPGGKIENAYCTCTAGLLGSCNHVAGLLFRVEAAVRTGLTKPSSTSQRCLWNLPSQSMDLLKQPARASDVSWTKDHYMNQDNSHTEDAARRSLFSPMSPGQQRFLSNKENTRKHLADALRDHVPDSSFMQLVDKKKKRPPVHTAPLLPLSIMDTAIEFQNDWSELNEVDAISFILDKMQLSPKERQVIEQATKNQSATDCWHSQRRGRITASKMKSVFTRMKTISAQPSADPTAVIKNVMGYGAKVSTPAMKYGLAQERHAKRLYCRLSHRSHRQLHTLDSGLVIHENIPYLAASPDLLVECSCHGKGMCEIKCPYSIRDSRPSESNLPYLENKAGKITLKKTHEYYYQMQGGMGVLGLKYCDFFVYTSHGYFLEHVEFDGDLWREMMSIFRQFWMTYIGPEILNQEVWKKMQDEVVGHPEVGVALDHTYGGNQPLPKRTAKKTYTPKAAANMNIVYMCNVCKLDAISDVIQCDICSIWYHFQCVSLTKGNMPGPNEKWHCSYCE